MEPSIMRFFSKSPDGGKNSGVTGYFLVEIKPLFSIVLLKFSRGSREAFHEHAFNALTIWLKGSVEECHMDGRRLRFKAGDVKYTPRTCFHKIIGITDAWAISFRGPWVDRDRKS